MINYLAFVNDNMIKLLQHYQFRMVNGLWLDVAGNGGILADVLANWGFDIDYRTQFARIMDYERGLRILYRAYTYGKIEVDIYKMGDIK